MAIVYRGGYYAAAANPTGTINFDITSISSAAVGDVAIVVIYSRDGDASPKDFGTITGPTALNSTPVNTTNGGKIYIGYKVLDSTDVVTNQHCGSYAPTTDTNATTGYSVSVFGNVDASPIRTSVAPVSGGSSSTPDPPAITATSGDTLVAIMGIMDDDGNSGANLTAPSTYTLASGACWSTTAGTDAGSAVAYKIGGATGGSDNPGTFGNGSNANYWYAATLALKPGPMKGTSSVSGCATGDATSKRIRYGTASVTGCATGDATGNKPVPGIDLVVHLEMVDYGLGSSTSTQRTFNRSKIYLDPNHYDNATYYFEVVVTQATATSYDIDLYDVTNSSVKATISTGAATCTTKRFRSSSFTPASGKNVLAVRMPQTTSASDVIVFDARVVVVQAGATKTRLQFPLTHASYSISTPNDTTSFGPVDNTQSVTYTQATAAKNAIWLQERSHLDEISGWTIEAVLATSTGTINAYAGLFNVTDGSQVGSVEVSTGSTSIEIVDLDFADSNMSSHDGDEFEFRIKTDNASYFAYLFKAAIYVELTSLAKAQVYLRCCGYRAAGTSGISATNQRIFIDKDQFESGTTWYVETTGSDASVSPEGQTFIRRVSTDDGTGTYDINAGITLSSSKDRVRQAVTDAEFYDDYNNYGRISSSTGNTAMANVVLIAEVEASTGTKTGTANVAGCAEASSSRQKIGGRTANVAACSVASSPYVRIRDRTTNVAGCATGDSSRNRIRVRTADVAAVADTTANGAKTTTKLGTAEVAACSVASAARNRTRNRTTDVAAAATADGAALRSTRARTANVASCATADASRNRIRKQTSEVAATATASGAALRSTRARTADVAACSAASATGGGIRKRTAVSNGTAVADSSRSRTRVRTSETVGTAYATSPRPVKTGRRTAEVVGCCEATSAGKKLGTAYGTANVAATAYAESARNRTRAQSSTVAGAAYASSSRNRVRVQTATTAGCAVASGTGAQAGSYTGTGDVAGASYAGAGGARTRLREGEIYAVAVSESIGDKVGVSSSTATEYGCAYAEARGNSSASQYNTLFAVAGDVNWSSAPDKTHPPAPFIKVAQAIQNSGAEFLCHTGDHVNDNTVDAYNGYSFSVYDTDESTYLTIPIWRCPGDNDHITFATRQADWNTYFSELPTSPDPNRRYYSHREGIVRKGDNKPVHIIHLSTNAPNYGGGLGTTQRNWLEAELAEISQPKLIVIIMHETLVKMRTSDYYYTHASEVADLKQLFAHYGVDMVISGSIHVFRRTDVECTYAGISRTIPFIQVPPWASQSHIVFSDSTIPDLAADEWGWETANNVRKGFITIEHIYNSSQLRLRLWSVDHSSGAVTEVTAGISPGLTSSPSAFFEDNKEIIPVSEAIYGVATAGAAGQKISLAGNATATAYTSATGSRKYRARTASAYGVATATGTAVFEGSSAVTWGVAITDSTGSRARNRGASSMGVSVTSATGGTASTGATLKVWLGSSWVTV